ncbi:MAG: OsmC family protein [Spirochaetales bacterium]|nr:OsmC family protein [Spirochaetales bacterium]
MPSKTSLNWTGGMSFDVELHGHSFTIDSDEQFGGKDRGPRPKTLLLSSLGGCTGMDVVSLLGKMKVPFDSFRLEVEGKLSHEHPSVYTDILVRYIFSGPELDRSKIEKAVKLSMEKYCGVTAMLEKTARISHEIILNPAG